MDYKKYVGQLAETELFELAQIWKKLNLEWQLCSGLTVKVQNHAEWKAYNDIFVDREYDLPIEHALGARHNPDTFTFLDLGANVGFFTLRTVDLLLSKTPAIDFYGVLVEGSPSVYEELKQRIDQELQLNGKLSVINGLIGDREGVGEIFETAFHITNSLFTRNASRHSSQVPYVDLNALYANEAQIDLLKSDIQGSEQRLLENYHGDLLKKVRCGIFELHHDVCDPDRCLEILREEFANHKPLKLKTSHLSNLSVHFFWRS
ncbi:MAG: FkbM family methyltransferase [Cyanobacteria bacterium CRU_2_1]|nr:FkbM family methyltransferase [Cyanobacteria bacterium CRU_2_1]